MTDFDTTSSVNSGGAGQDLKECERMIQKSLKSISILPLSIIILLF
jgi:hypothetical protein